MRSLRAAVRSSGATEGRRRRRWANTEAGRLEHRVLGEEGADLVVHHMLEEHHMAAVGMACRVPLLAALKFSPQQ